MKTMHSIKRVSVLMVLFLLVTALSAQGQDERQRRFEEMKAKRAGFFTERIGLTPSEAERFWPIYNSLQSEKGKLSERTRKLFMNTKVNNKGEKVPDFKRITDEMINIKVKEANLEKLYHEKFKKILSPEKLFRYYQAEVDWGKELLRLFQRRG